MMKSKKFQGEEKALDMIEETVADVVSSCVNDERQSFKGEVQHLLKEGIEVDINKMGAKDLIAELEDREIKLSRDDKKGKTEKLREKLKGEKVKLRLKKTVVGALISTLFFNCRDELTKKPFELKISPMNKSQKEKEINELKEKIDSKSFVKEKVLEKIKLLNSSSHIFNNWFFREVLAAIVNDEGRLDKLQAVCAAICKEPMQKLLRGAKVHKDVVDVLEFFGVKISSSQITTPEIPTNLTSLDLERNGIGEKGAETTELREMEEVQNRVGTIEAQLIELKKAVKDLQEASTSQQQSVKAANNQQKESGSDTQFGQQQEPNAQATSTQQHGSSAQATSDSTVPPMSRNRSSSLSSGDGGQPGPSSKLDEVPPISRSQSLNSLHSDDSDIEVISKSQCR